MELRQNEEKKRRKEIKKRKRKEKLRQKKQLKKRRFKRCQQKGCNRKIYNVSTRTKEVIACERCLTKIFLGLKKNTYPDLAKSQKKIVKRWFRLAQAQYQAFQKKNAEEVAEWISRIKRITMFEQVQVMKNKMFGRAWKRRKIYKRMGIM